MSSSLGMVSPPGRRHVPWPSAAIRLPGLFALCLATSQSIAQTLPYTQTTILLSNANIVPLQQNISSDAAYIFSPLDGTVALLSLNVSGTVKTSALDLQTLSSKLPFLASNNTSFASTIADNGTLVVYAGDCSSSNNASVWTLDPPADGSEGQWRERTISSSANLAQFGPRFLGGSLSFSTTLEPVMDPATIYAYGGMCHNSSLDPTSSQAQASYSNQMIKLSPAASDSSTFSAHAMSNKGSPVPEAGFTLTGLSPSIANRSGTATQQVNYVLLGGHTQQAFVNLSTAAIWSLPEEAWGFVNIETPGSTSSIDARSGHTAVLNEAGDTLIVLGGWVGNTQQAASPQLAALNIGLGYGGKGEWQWSVPDNQPSGVGIYGHGAALLPGNVMMVYGGYGISASEGRARRQTGGSSSPKFLNLTSMAWIEEYTNPSSHNVTGSTASSSADSESAKRRLGLGLGLGLGLAAILGAIVVYFGWRGYKGRKYASRENMIRSLAQDTSHFIQDEPMSEREDGRVYWYTGGHDPYSSGGHSLGYETLRNGRGSMDGGRTYAAVSAARGLGAPRAARGQHQPTPISVYDPPPGCRGPLSASIHPIYEADEESYVGEDEPPSPVKEPNDLEGARLSDPFLTPTGPERPSSFPLPGRASATPSPEYRPHPDPEVQDWMSDIDAADALLTQRMTINNAGSTGRVSPVRRNTVKSLQASVYGDDDGRTNSNISESNRINLSRSGSTRSYLRAVFDIGATAAEGRQDAISSNSEESQNSYHTAKSISTLQAEGPSLLMGARRRYHAHQDDGGGGGGGDDDLDLMMPGSPSKSKFRRSWLGSLRRVFSGPTPSPSPPLGASSPVRDSMGESSDFDPRLGGLGSIAAGGLFKRKGGRGAWEAEDVHGDSGVPPGGRGAGSRPDEDDWDIEKAIERRLVQVMFTVPKERLRVVNAGPEMESAESAVLVDPDDDDDANHSDSGSVRRYQLRDDGPGGGGGEPARDPEGFVLVEEGAGDDRPDKGKQRMTADSSLGTELDGDFRSHMLRDMADSGLGSDLMMMMMSSSSRSRQDAPMPSIEPDEPMPSVESDEHAMADVMHEEDEGDEDDEDEAFLAYTERRRSRMSEQSDAQVRIAEAVKLESPGRPRTRVLELVELIESRSRSGSPERP